MFGVKRKKLLMLAVAFVMVVPVATWAIIKNSTESENVSAITYEIPTGYTTFTDANFYDCVAQQYKNNHSDADISGGLTDAQLAGITELYCYNEEIKNVEGLEKMTALIHLSIRNNQLTSLDVSNNTALTYLEANNNQLTSLDVSNNTALKELYVSRNQLTSLGVSNNTALTTLSANNNQLTSLDVSNNTALKELYVGNNQLTSLDVSNHTALTELYVDENQLTSLNVSKNTALITLYADKNQLISLNVSDNTALTGLYANHNQLTSLNVSKNTALIYLEVNYNQLTLLDVSNNTALTHLEAYDNQLISLDVSDNTALKNLSVHNNQLTSLDVSNNTALTILCADHDTLIKANIVIESLSPNIELNLSNLKFVISIDDTDNYTYNEDSKIATIINPNKTNGYLESIGGGKYTKFQLKLQIPNFVSFDVNGGTGSIDNQTCYPDTTNGSCSITIPSTEPTRTNYVFLGWAETSDATSAAYQKNSEITIDGSKTLYAIWAPIYTVSFNVNGGTGSIDNQICYPDTTNGSCNITISSTEPTRTNYVFLGWAESSDATSASKNSGDSITLSSNKTLYAVWEENAPAFYTYTLTFNANAGGNTVSGMPSSQNCTTTGTNTSCNITIASSTPSRNGYTFLGWAESSDATSASKNSGNSITLSADKTLHAVWQRNPVTYTLNFNKNAGSDTVNGMPETITHSSNDATYTFTIPNTTPSRSGYDFDGWYLNGSPDTIYRAHSNIVAEYGSPSITVYAKWTVHDEGGDEGGDGDEGGSETSYEILNISTNEYDVNSGAPLIIEGSGDMDKFTTLKIDGVIVNSNNYSVSSGSTIVTISSEYLTTLESGSHTATLVWTDGEISTDFTLIKADGGDEGGDKKEDGDNQDNNTEKNEEDLPTPNTSKVKTPDTGENTNGDINIVAGVSCILIVAAFIFGGCYIYNRIKIHKKFEW